MYKIQETCDNCKFANFLGSTIMCFNNNSLKYNKEVSVAGKCENYKESAFFQEEKKEEE